MPKVVFIEHGGARHEFNAVSGDSAMRAAIEHGVPGVLAECGGAMTCATCHVYVAAEWLDRVGVASEDERQMLEMAIEPRPESRLSCQIVFDDALDGVILNIPKSQF